MRNRTLGKGLSALLSDSSIDNDTQVDTIERPSKSFLNIDDLMPGTYQPRKKFIDESLNELADSIKSKGILLPLIVRPKGHFHEIVAGERRWRAARMIGLKEVPVIIRDLTDQEALEFALLENIQRQDLTPIEEAESYKKLIDEFNYTHENLSKHIGKSRSHISNILRLLSLPEEVKELVDSGHITTGHAKVISGNENAKELAEMVFKNKMSVRDLESFMSKDKIKVTSSNSKRKIEKSKDEELVNIENGLTEYLGLRVKIEDSNEGGKVVIYFHNLEQLDHIIQKLNS